MKKYVITDICKADAFYDEKDELIGKEIAPCKKRNGTWIAPHPFAGWNYGDFIVGDEDYVFFAVKYEEVRK